MPVLPLFLALAAQAADVAPASGASEAPAGKDARDCSAHKFESVVSAQINGTAQSKRIMLCGVTGQSDSDWIRTLEDSVATLEANFNLAKPMREAMVAALKGEVTRLRGGVMAIAPTPSTKSAPSAPVTGEITLKPRAATPKGRGMADYNGLPPLPDPVSAKAKEAAYVPPPPIIKPKLTFNCMVSGAIGEAPCDELDRHGFVVVRARDNVGPGVNLHFVLNGSDKGEIELSGMRKGQRLNLALPSEVCRGTAGGKLEMRVMVQPAAQKFAPQRAETIGPAILRCA